MEVIKLSEEENKEIEEKNEKVVMDPELVEFIKMEIEEKKKEKEREEREEAIQELKKYVPHLVSVPEKYNAQGIRVIAKALSEFQYKPREERPSFIKDAKRNLTVWVLLGAIVVVGIIGVIF